MPRFLAVIVGYVTLVSGAFAEAQTTVVTPSSPPSGTTVVTPAPAPPPAQPVIIQQAPPAPAPSQTVVVQPAPPPTPPPPADALGPDRFSLIYSPEVPLTTGSLPTPSGGHGAGVQSIGLEISTIAGLFARYHAQIAYANVDGFSGVRFDPLGLGWAFPILKTEYTSFEIEPMLSLADGVILFTNDTSGNSNVTLLLSSGASIQGNLSLGPLYMFLSPVGIEVRYLEATSGSGHMASTAADPFWRFRVGIGVQY